MTPTKSQTELHRRSAEIAEQIAEFEQSGGQIMQVDIGVSAEMQARKQRYKRPKNRAGGRPAQTNTPQTISL